MKNYRLQADDFKQLVAPMGSCIATDKITVDGLPVQFMYRQESDDESDSGWRFFQEPKRKNMLTMLATLHFTMSILLQIMTLR